MSSVAVTLITKPECHLCDAARGVVTSVVASLPAELVVGVSELSIFDDPALLAKYEDEIPVVLIDGRVHNIWRVEPDRLRSALLEAAQ
jgi:hypothetical protein